MKYENINCIIKEVELQHDMTVFVTGDMKVLSTEYTTNPVASPISLNSLLKTLSDDLPIIPNKPSFIKGIFII